MLRLQESKRGAEKEEKNNQSAGA